MGPYRSGGHEGSDYESRVHNGKSYTKLMQPSLWSPYPHVYVTKVESTVLIRQAWRERRPIRGEMGLSLRNFQNEREREREWES